MADYCEPYSLQIEQEHAVSIDAEPDTLLVTAGEQGPPGASAFEVWQALNPGGTWDTFLSDVGSGATWHSTDW